MPHKKTAKPHEKHHLEFATWSKTHENGELVLTADFALETQIDGRGYPNNPHYFGARLNVKAFGEWVDRKNPNVRFLRKNTFSFNPEEQHNPPGGKHALQRMAKREFKIRIAGDENCHIFVDWLGHNCMPICEQLAQMDVPHATAAMLRNSTPINPDEERKSTEEQQEKPPEKQDTPHQPLLFGNEDMRDMYTKREKGWTFYHNDLEGGDPKKRSGGGSKNDGKGTKGGGSSAQR